MFHLWFIFEHSRVWRTASLVVCFFNTLASEELLQLWFVFQHSPRGSGLQGWPKTKVSFNHVRNISTPIPIRKVEGVSRMILKRCSYIFNFEHWGSGYLCFARGGSPTVHFLYWGTWELPTLRTPWTPQLDAGGCQPHEHISCTPKLEKLYSQLCGTNLAFFFTAWTLAFRSNFAFYSRTLVLPTPGHELAWCRVWWNWPRMAMDEENMF